MKLKEIAIAVNGTLSPETAGELEIDRVTSLAKSGKGAITFITKKTMREPASISGATAVLTREGWSIDGVATIIVADPYWAYAQIALLFEDSSPIFGAQISSSAVVDSTAKIGKNVSIGPGSVIGSGVFIGNSVKIDARVVIEKNATIGENSHIHSGAIIRYGVICGERNIISSGAVIGSEGFANGFNGKDFLRIPCFGTVVLEDDVEIGANTTIDRGNFENTIVRRGARIDNLIMIAHNVEIGESCGIAAQVGFAGSTTLGKRVMIGGQAGFGGHISIGDDSFVGGQAGIQASFPEKSKITGSPAIDLMKRRRIDTAETKLPDALRELKKLRKELDEIKISLTTD